MARVATLRRTQWGSQFDELLASRWAEPVGVFAFAFACFVFFLFTGQGQHDLDGWFPLANQMLHGHLWVNHDRPWIEMSLGPDGHWYLPFPPIPAVVLIPGVALFGQEFADTGSASAFAGAVDIVLVWILLRQVGLSKVASAWFTFSFALGSEATYVAWQGGVHHWPEMLGLGFALGATILALRGQWPWASGALIVLAAGCRPAYVLVAAGLLFIYAWPRIKENRAEILSRLVLFCLGAIPVGLFLLWYNDARFGTPFEFGYTKILGWDDTHKVWVSVLSEPWYSQGIENVNYIARGLYTLLLRTPNFVEDPPWLQPSWAGMSIILVMPVILYLVKATMRDPWIVGGWLMFLLPLIIDLCHGNPGYAQWGYRFILDSFPGLWLLLALVVKRHGVTPGMRVAIFAGVASVFYGMWAITANPSFMSR